MLSPTSIPGSIRLSSSPLPRRNPGSICGRIPFNVCLRCRDRAGRLILSPRNSPFRNMKATPNAVSDGDEEAQRISLQDSVLCLIPEVAALDFPPDEIRQFLAKAKSPPKGFDEFDMQRTIPVFDELLLGKLAGRVEDVDAMGALKASLMTLWKWKRRGGDSQNADLPIHMSALEDLYGVAPDDSEKISSLLLDDLPISDEQKADLSGAVQTVAVAGIQTLVWNGIGLAVIFLIAFNFFLLGR